MLRKPRQLKSEELQIQILKLLSKNASKSFDTYQISRKINVSNPPSSIQEELNKLVTKGLVIKTKTGIYRINSAQKLHPIQNPFSGLCGYDKIWSCLYHQYRCKGGYLCSSQLYFRSSPQRFGQG